MKRTLAGTAVLAVVLTISALAQTGSAAPGGAAATPAAPTTAATSGGVKVGIIDIQQAIVATNEGARDSKLCRRSSNRAAEEGDIEVYLDGAASLESMKSGGAVLMLEACSIIARPTTSAP